MQLIYKIDPASTHDLYGSGYSLQRGRLTMKCPSFIVLRSMGYVFSKDKEAPPGISSQIVTHTPNQSLCGAQWFYGRHVVFACLFLS